jgi:1,4-alpha-glucan branching enzyme
MKALIIIVFPFLFLSCGTKEIKEGPVPLGGGIAEFTQVSVTCGNIEFVYNPAWAETPPETISFAGDRNKWALAAEGYIFRHSDDGSFRLTLKFVPGTYHYCFVINGVPVKNMTQIAVKISPQPTRYATNGDTISAVLEVGE